MHAHTFTGEGKPAVLLDVMRACGALMTKTPEAASFVYRTLSNAREFLLQELVSVRLASCRSSLLMISVQSSRANGEAYTRDLLTAAILLQTIGVFHEDPTERQRSSIFHGFLVKARYDADHMSTRNLTDVTISFSLFHRRYYGVRFGRQ